MRNAVPPNESRAMLPGKRKHRVCRGAWIVRHFMGGMYGKYWAKSQQRKKTIGIWIIICRTA